MNMPWFRYHWNTLNYHKLVSIAAEADEEPILILGVWTGLLCIAGRGDPGPEGGRLLITTDRPARRPVLAREIGIDEERFARLLDLFVEYGSVEYTEDCWRIRNWGEYQMASDNSTPRVRAWRERQKAKKQAAGRPPKSEELTPAAEEPIGEYDEVVQGLVDHFIEVTGIMAPSTGDVRRWSMDWIQPIRALLKLANDDLETAKIRMTAVVALMHKKRLKITRPGSLVTPTRRWLSEQAWDLVRDEILRVGAYAEPQLGEELAQAVRNAGGWRQICTAETATAADRFTNAYLRGLK